MAVFAIDAQAETLAGASRIGTEWELREINRLRDMRAQGLSVTEMARRLNRTYFAVTTQLSLQGLTKPRVRRMEVLETACPRCYLVHRGECL